jgi:Superinfection immunity protein
MLTSSFLFFPFFHFHPFFWLISLFLYFLPAFLARNKPNFTGILILNILAGWTLIGWIIALVWALSSGPQPQAAPPLQQATAPAAQPAASSAFFCSSCGKRCTAGEHFCSSCGAALPLTQR